MKSYSLSHLADSTLLHDLSALVVRDRVTTAAMLAHLAEVDARKLYLPAGYPSMYAYSVEKLRLSEDAAYKRIQAGRVARQFPGVFDALADGRLHLTGLGLLAPHLTRENADQLLGAAANKSKAGIEQLIAERFPRPELLALVESLPPSAPPPNQQPTPAHVEPDTSDPVRTLSSQLAPAQVGAPTPPSRVQPCAPKRYALHLTIDQSTYDQLQYAKALLSHSMPSGDIAKVLDRALHALIDQLERRKFGARRSRGQVTGVQRQADVTSRRTSGAPSGSETRANARSSARLVIDARHASFWSSIMSIRWHAAARRRCRGYDCNVTPITSTRRSERSAPGS